MKFSEEMLLSEPLLVAEVLLDTLVRVAENERKAKLRELREKAKEVREG